METSDLVALSALVVSIIGWIVAYRLGLRSQRQMSYEAAQNEARKELTIALRRLIAWCSEVNGVLQSAEMFQKLATLIQSDATVAWRAEERLNLFHTDKRSLEWLERLEEFEILFPHTKPVRGHLLNWNRRLHDELSALYKAHSEGSVAPSDVAARAESRLGDLTGFAWDLMIYVQNQSFGHVTKRRVAPRQPADHKAPRLREGANRDLRIVDGDGQPVIG